MSILKKAKQGKVKQYLDIDDIDASLTPSLVGYWKCDEGQGDTILDYSGNNYHLIIQNSFALAGEADPINADLRALDEASRWAQYNDYVSFGYGAGAFIDLADAPLLDTGSNTLIFGAEIIWHDDTTGLWNNLGVDFDIGTYYHGDDSSGLYDDHYAPAQGFNLYALTLGGANQTTFGVRTSDDTTVAGVDLVLGATNKGSNNDALYDTYAQAGAATVDKNTSLALGYEASAEVHFAHSIDGSDSRYVQTSLLSVPKVPAATLPAQKLDGITKMFGIRCQNSYAPRWAVRNIYCWSFDSAQSKGIGNIAQWFAANPGKIPSWLIGE